MFWYEIIWVVWSEMQTSGNVSICVSVQKHFKDKFNNQFVNQLDFKEKTEVLFKYSKIELWLNQNETRRAFKCCFEYFQTIYKNMVDVKIDISYVNSFFKKYKNFNWIKLAIF